MTMQKHIRETPTRHVETLLLTKVLLEDRRLLEDATQ